MRKLLKTQDLLLLGLAHVIDIFEEFENPLGIVGKAYENFYGWVPKRYKKHNFSHLVWRNLKTGYIEKIIKDGFPYFRLTSQGQEKIQRDFPLLAIQSKTWDKKWRLVTFDIEEVSRLTREKFRDKLKELGFGMLQESVFISPYNIALDIAQFIENYGLEKCAYVLEVSEIVSGNAKTLANKVWHLNDLNKKYKTILEEIENNHLISFDDRRLQLKTQDHEKLQSQALEIKQNYLRLVVIDPFLPKELLPEDWMGNRVRKLIGIK